MDKITTSKKYHMIENIYCTLLGIYLLFSMTSVTTFNFSYPKTVTYVLLGLLSVSAGTKSLLYFSDMVKGAHRIPWELLLALIPAISYCLSYVSGRYSFLLVLAIATVGCLGTDYRKLLTLYVMVAGVFLIGTTFCCICGGITNYVYIKDGYMRSSWGIYYPTDYASFLIYISIAAWIAFKRIRYSLFFIIGVLITMISYFINRSDTSTICGILFLLILLYYALMEYSGERFLCLKRIRKVIDALTVASFSLFACLVFGLIYLYRKGLPLAYKIDDLMSSRLHYASVALDRYGVSLFGKKFDMIGFGGSTFNNANYDFIDSSYALILIRYGLMTFLIIAIIWTLTTYRAIIIEDRRLALGMALIAFHSISEHHFIEIFYNILLVMPFALFAKKDVVGDLKPASDTVKQTSIIPGLISILLVFCMAGSFMIGVIPSLLSRIRTLCSICEVRANAWEKVVLFIIGIIATGIFIFVIMSIYHILSDIFRKKMPSCFYLVGLCLCIVICLIAYVQSGKVIDRSMKAYQEELEGAEPVVKLILENDNAKLYVDNVPEIFDRRFGGISNSFFSGDELARYDDISIIMRANYESACFLRKGFLYCQISPEYAIYTNDNKVISRLSESGYHLTGYFSKKRKVNLKKMAELNDLSLSDDGTLFLSGKKEGLTSGPNIPLRGANYTTTFHLRINQDELKNQKKYRKNDKDKAEKQNYDPIVCRLRISTYSGDNIIEEVPVTLSQFNKNGNCKTEVSYYIPESFGVDFEVIPENGHDIIVRAVFYQQTPDYDTHRYYDSKNRVIREVYYDLEGNKYTTVYGYSSCTYEYDERDNIRFIKYYDENNRLTITTMGYAMIHKLYDLNRQIIREEYFNTKEDPLTLFSGCAAVEYSYDDSGHQVESRYYNIDNKPTLWWGYAFTVKKYFDDRNLVIKEEYFDTSGNLWNCPDGYSSMKHEYDEKGNKTWTKYYNSENKPIATSNGYAAIHMTYDINSHMIRQEYYGLEGEQTVLLSGQFATEYEYDDNGNQSFISYYNKDNKPVRIWNSHAGEERIYNDKNQITSLKYYDEEKHPILCAWGYAVEKREYDNSGNIIAQSYYDLNNKPVIKSDGYHEVQKFYDESQHVIREEFFGTNGKPISLPEGYSSIIRSYDKYGNMTNEQHLDVKGNPVSP